MGNIITYFKRAVLIVVITLVYFLLAQGWIFKQECKDSKSHKNHNHQNHQVVNYPKEAQLAYRIAKSIDYKYIQDEKDYWQAPFESERRGKEFGHEIAGDCEDASIYLIYRLRKVGINAGLVVGRVAYTGFGIGHAWVRVIVMTPNGEELYDIDMVEKRIWKSLIEEPITQQEIQKLWETEKRQQDWESGVYKGGKN